MICEHYILPNFECAAEEWYRIVEAVRDVWPNYPVYNCLQQYGICARAVVSQESFLLWEIFKGCGGLGRIASPQEYLALDARYIDAAQIIADEMNIQEKIKADG